MMFQRECRYGVVKLSDVHEALSKGEREQLTALMAKIKEHRLAQGKAPLECVVVESDWPIYEDTWAAVERMATGIVDESSQVAESVRGDMSSISLDGHALLDLLEFIAPDRETDQEQLETEVCLFEKAEPFKVADGSMAKPGVYAYLVDYPDEGIYGPLGEPA